MTREGDAGDEAGARYESRKESMEDIGEASAGSIDALGSRSVSDSGWTDTTNAGRLGDFRLLREVGRGGMGIVYEAEQESLGRRVALKVLPSGALCDPKHVRRFEREARSAARLHHTNIVPVFGVGRHEETNFYVMQFIEGKGLDAVLKELKHLRAARTAKLSGSLSIRSPAQTEPRTTAVEIASSPSASADEATVAWSEPLTSPETTETAPGREWIGGTEVADFSETDRRYAQGVARIGLQAADALAHAHAQGILHRDIKPSNLILDRDGNVWVADFGLAKTADVDNLTHTGDIIGTVRYMAPERFRGRGDARVDIYALGLTLYELLALRPAFDLTDRASLIRQVTQETPPRLRKLNRAVPADLETIVHKAMAREPDQRYATASAMAEDLRRFLEGRPILARRVSGAERAWRWCKRNPTVAGLIGAVALLLAALAIGSAMAADHFRRMADQAKRQADKAAENARFANREAIRADKEAKRANDEKLRSEQRLYVSEIGLVQQAKQEFQTDLMRERLQILKPQAPGDIDLRGFEWYYLRRLCETKAGRLRGHEGPVFGVAFGPGGRRLISAGSSDRTFKIWDVASGRLFRSIDGKSGALICVAFRPDGRQIATGGSDGTARLWNADSGESIRILRGNRGPVFCLAYDPDGRLLAGAGEDPSIKLWDPDSGREIQTLRGHAGRVVRIAFDREGRRLASASHDGSAKIWDVRSATLIRTLRGHSGEVWGVSFHPDGDQLATSGADGTVRIWNLKTGREIRVLTGHSHSVDTVTFRPDGRQLASSGADGTLRIWDAFTGRLLQTYHGHGGTVVHCAAFGPDGKLLASGGSDSIVKIWDISRDQENLVLRGHTAEVLGIAFGPDGRRLASGGLDRTVRIWNADNGEELRVLRGHTSPVSRAEFSPDGRRLASAGHDGTVRLWNPESGELIRTLRGHVGLIGAASFRPDGKLLATAGDDAAIKIWDSDGRPLKTLLGHRGAVRSLSFGADGKLLASGGVDATVKLWDVDAGRVIKTLRGHDAPVFVVTFDPKGRLLASGGGDGTARIWEVDGDRPPQVLSGHAGAVNGLSFSADGRRLASAGFDPSVRLWDVATGRQVLNLNGPAVRHLGLAFAPDGRRLAAGFENTIVVWDASTPSPRTLAVREAASLADSLFDQGLSLDSVRKRIADDRFLDADLRRLALDLAGPHADRLLERQAERLVNGLYEKPLLRPEVLAALRNDPALDEALRQRALSLAERIPESHSRLNNVAWAVVHLPDASPQAYRTALKQAEAAARLAPFDGYTLNTLGVAQYRVGLHREAVESLKRSERLCSQIWTRSLPPNLAFLSMALHRLGRSGEADAFLKRLRADMRKPEYSENEEFRAFLQEAESLRKDLFFPADPFSR